MMYITKVVISGKTPEWLVLFGSWRKYFNYARSNGRCYMLNIDLLHTLADQKDLPVVYNAYALLI